MLEQLVSVTDDIKTLRVAWRVHRNYDFTPDQAGLSDFALNCMRSALGKEVDEDLT